MKKQMILFTLVVVNLFLVTKVSAIENNNYRNIKESARGTTPGVTPIKQMFEENREMIKEQRTITRSTVSAEKEVLSDTVLTNMINMLNTRLQNAVDRLNKRANLLETVTVKIDERVTQVESERGLSLTEARTFLNQAKTEFTNSKVLISNIKINPVTTKTQLDTERQSLKVQVEKAYQSLKKVSSLLRQSVNKAVEKYISTTPKVRSSINAKPTINPIIRRGDPVVTVGEEAY